MTIEKTDPMIPDLTMPIIFAIIVGVICTLWARLEKKNAKQTGLLLLKAEMFVLPLFAAELLPTLLIGKFDYEEAYGIKGALFLVITVVGEALVYRPYAQKIKEQQRIENEEYYRRIEEMRRSYDPAPENLFRVRVNDSPDYQNMPPRQKANFDVNKMLSMSKNEKGEAFEEYISEMLRGMGYSKVRLTKTTGDYGADAIAENENDVLAIQCKCYQNSVGIDAVYQILGGASYYNANKLIVVTTGNFTPQAKVLAERSSVKLIDRGRLINIVERYYSELAENSTVSKGF